MVKIDWVKDQLRKLCGQTGIAFSGGEPMLQVKACKEIADWARKELSWNILSFIVLCPFSTYLTVCL